MDSRSHVSATTDVIQLAQTCSMPYHAQAPGFRGLLYARVSLFEDCLMKPKLQKTYTPKPGDLSHEWFVVDAADVPLGRLASNVAQILRGKHKPTFAPHMDMGDHVIVVNASKIVLSSNKAERKYVHSHSGYPGGLTTRTYQESMDRRPADTVRKSITGMLPKNRLGAQMATKLKVYAGPDHPHGAQMPTVLEFPGARREVKS